MKADSTVKKELRALRSLIDSPGIDNLTKRIAYEIECAIRWAREDVKQWPRPVESAAAGANLIREEVKQGEIKL